MVTIFIKEKKETVILLKLNPFCKDYNFLLAQHIYCKAPPTLRRGKVFLED